jgi:FG-GAP repeat
VGDANNDGLGEDAGRAWLFNASTGALIAELHDPNSGPSDRFGSSVAITENYIAVGGLRDDAAVNSAGAVHVYSKTGAFIRTLVDPQPFGNEQFGVSVAALEGDKLVVGANFDRQNSVGIGGAFLFDLPSGGMLKSLDNPVKVETTNFGIQLATWNNRLLVAAHAYNGPAFASGIAYLYDSRGLLLQTVSNPEPGPSDFFGLGIAGIGNRIVVGAVGDQTAGNSTGAAYLFRVVPEPETLVPAIATIVWMAAAGRFAVARRRIYAV